MSDSFHHYSDAANSGPPSGGYEWAHLFWGYPVPPVSDGSMNFLIWDLITRRNPKDLLICKYFKESFEIAKDSGCPVIAIDQSLDSYSPSFLTRLGWHLNPSRAPRTLISPFVEEAAKAVRKSGCRKVVLWSAMKRLPELRAALPDCTIAFAQRHFDYPSTWAYYKDCDLLITQTRGQTKFAFDRHRWVTPFCVSIPNGAELDEFSPAEKDGKKALRQSLGIPENALVVMFPSKLAQHKGSRHLQRMIKICAQDPSLFFLVVGSLHRGLPAAHRLELKQTLTEGENVLWKNKIPRSEMPDLYRAADICWMPCLWREGFSMAATEALASGVPVIASRSGFYPEVVFDGYNGFLFGQEGLMAASLSIFRKLRDDADLLNEMSANSRSYAEARLSRKKVLANFDCFLEDRLEDIDGDLSRPG